MLIINVQIVVTNFRKLLRKAATDPVRAANSRNQSVAMSPGENTGLISGRSTAGRKGVWRQFYDVLGSNHYSAGKDSDIKLVRALAPTILATKITLYSNYVNFLLVFVPLGIVGGFLEWNPSLVFILNFMAVVPLAAVLSFATEEISLKVGETLGGLLNATFGNAVEMIVRQTIFEKYFVTLLINVR